jgi:hypothetical protein
MFRHIRSVYISSFGDAVKKIILLLVLSLVSPYSSAAFDCNVSIRNVLIYTDGSVNILHSGRGDYTVICNLNAERQGVSPAVCGMWTGMLQLIKRKGGQANFYFDGTGTCAELPVYAGSPAPVYIGDVTP